MSNKYLLPKAIVALSQVTIGLGATALAFFTVPALAAGGLAGFGGAWMVGLTSAALVGMGAGACMFGAGLTGLGLGAIVRKPVAGAQLGATLGAIAGVACLTNPAYTFTKNTVENGFGNTPAKVAMLNPLQDTFAEQSAKVQPISGSVYSVSTPSIKRAA